ncbi:MAG: hypothetical protein COA79_20355 [Planctomycetota bacterium]|nr:MAG: hypothetical protein COA79_20355 [Planctomycetota bacterium]
MEPAQPFIIQVVSASASSISDVDIGDAYGNRALVQTASRSPFGADPNITLSSGVIGVTYIEWLAETERRPFKVGLTEIISSSAGQIDNPITITHRGTQGGREDHAIIPSIDPNQGLTDRGIADDYEYMFDGYTRLRLSQVNGLATVTIKIYPISVLKRIIADGHIDFRKPHITRVSGIEEPHVWKERTEIFDIFVV